jgi:hypothetical protein
MYLYVYVFSYIFIYLFMYCSIHLCIYTFIYLVIYLFIYLFVFISLHVFRRYILRYLCYFTFYRQRYRAIYSHFTGGFLNNDMVDCSFIWGTIFKSMSPGISEPTFRNILAPSGSEQSCHKRERLWLLDPEDEGNVILQNTA